MRAGRSGPDGPENTGRRRRKEGAAAGSGGGESGSPRRPAERVPGGGQGEKGPGENLVAVGRITGTYGVRGWLRVFPLTDFPERFYRLERVFLTGGRAPGEYHVERVEAHGRFFLLKFKEVPDANAAPALKGGFVCLPREELVPLPPGTYYVFELLGAAVYSTEGEFLGELKDVLQTGANDVYVVESGRGAPLLVPALKQVVKEVDLENRRVLVDLPPGLRE